MAFCMRRNCSVGSLIARSLQIGNTYMNTIKARIIYDIGSTRQKAASGDMVSCGAMCYNYDRLGDGKRRLLSHITLRENINRAIGAAKPLHGSYYIMSSDTQVNGNARSDGRHKPVPIVMAKGPHEY